MVLHSPSEAAARYRGSFPRTSAEIATWHATSRPERILDPALAIIDPHHHLFGMKGDRNSYEFDDLARDIGGGHRVIGTVYVEAYEAGWRAAGPEALRPVGEIETIVAQTRQPIITETGSCRVAAGIVGFADLRLGDAVCDVLDALIEAGEGRLCGVRHRVAVTRGIVGRSLVAPPSTDLLSAPEFRDGLKQLAAHQLPFDVWIYHEQLPELIELADALPRVPLVLNHVGGLIGIAERQAEIDAARRFWATGMQALAKRPNVSVKIGGMGMPVFGYGFEHGAVPASSKELADAWRANFSICLESFGARRCMFESNFPVDQQAANYVAIWNAFKRLSWGLSVTERNALFHGTAARVYGLEHLLNAAALPSSRGT